MQGWYRPLESGKVILVKSGAMNSQWMKALADHANALVIPVFEIDCVRVLVPDEEPADRIAGAISEDV